jgi:hypothetical protein
MARQRAIPRNARGVGSKEEEARRLRQQRGKVESRVVYNDPTEPRYFGKQPPNPRRKGMHIRHNIQL